MENINDTSRLLTSGAGCEYEKKRSIVDGECDTTSHKLHNDSQGPSKDSPQGPLPMVLQERFVVSSSLAAAVRLVWLQLIESHPTNVFLRHASM